ncbi:hypothetical protein KP509_35G045700 [Ceratopteris richardii]|uniref:Uncharacterized protein n=1 Tax=Ceratopteris richardii TaxID=49495 RepID=A0A8T2QGM7_CERRI|nr:hypothetical protein KP509_35G045700 [Ceratopteris richardii]
MLGSSPFCDGEEEHLQISSVLSTNTAYGESLPSMQIGLQFEFPLIIDVNDEPPPSPKLVLRSSVRGRGLPLHNSLPSGRETGMALMSDSINAAVEGLRSSRSAQQDRFSDPPSTIVSLRKLIRNEMLGDEPDGQLVYSSIPEPSSGSSTPCPISRPDNSELKRAMKTSLAASAVKWTLKQLFRRRVRTSKVADRYAPHQ